MSEGNILIIDNERRMCHVLKVALEAEGYKIELAFDGDEGIEKLKNTIFDVIITDLKMPNKDGIQVLDAAKKLSQQTEVIMMTAYASLDKAMKAIAYGATDLLIKPFEFDRLMEVLDNSLKGRKSPSSSELPPGRL